MDDMQYKKAIADYLSAKEEMEKRKALKDIELSDEEKEMIQNMTLGMSGGLANVGKPLLQGAAKKLVDVMEPRVSEEGLVSPVAEKFTGIRRFLQELGGTGGETAKSKAIQEQIKSKAAADEANAIRELQEYSMRNKPSDEQIALDRYMIDRQVDKIMQRNNPDKTFDLKLDRRK